ncbi:MAG: hypothetical protein JXQ90_18115 [Cyclobacteriaceae bacterium]
MSRMNFANRLLVKLVFVWSLLISATDVFGQDIYLKSEEGDDIQFAYAHLNSDSTNTFFSDINGKLTFDFSVGDAITIGHPDYHTHVFELINYSDSIIFELQHQESRGVKFPGMHLVDPGFHIVEEIVGNNRLHDPEHVGGSFRYKTYSKTLVDLFKLKDHRLSQKYKDIVKQDSMFHRHHKSYGEQHVEVIETTTERTFEYPKRDHEKVLGLKVTGLHDDEITPLSSNLHPISFYDNYFDFLGISYASPVGSANYKKYDFHLEHALKSGEDSVFIISFKPSHLKFPGLVGRMYVNSNQYAIQAIVAEPSQTNLADFQISANYEFIDGKEWFPRQLNYLYSVEKFPKPYLGTVYDKKTYIKDIELNPDLSKEEKKVELIICDHYATQQEEEFWKTHRVVPLTKKERLTYLRVDTLRHKSTSANVVKRIAAFYKQDLHYRIPPIMDLYNVFNLGRYEGARLGLGAGIGKELFKVFEFSGYGAYGFRDKEWKYGYGGRFFLNKKHDAELQFEHQKDIREPGSVVYLNKEKDFFRSIFIGTMDRYESNHVKLSFRSPGYHLFELGLHDYTETALYDYQYINDDNSNLSSFNVTEFTLRTRIAFKERITHTLGSVNRLNSSYPILYINYNRGMNSMMNGIFEYNKISGAMDFRFKLGHIGVSDIAIEAGTVESDLPYPLLFNGRGGNLATSSVIIEDHFQTMSLYEYMSNRFFNVFYYHDFGSRIFGGSKFRPDIVVYHHMGWGKLDEPGRHQGTDLLVQSYNKGYFESGLGFNNIIKYKFFGKLYGGLGVSFFHRYGPHKLPGGFGENFATRITYVIRGV